VAKPVARTPAARVGRAARVKPDARAKERLAFGGDSVSCRRLTGCGGTRPGQPFPRRRASSPARG
jgi:hypothetical protein